jgi:hypothetical protein
MVGITRALSGRIALVGGALGLVLTLTPGSPVRADDDQDVGSTFARVRYVEGRLTLQRTGEGEVEEGAANVPLAPGDVAWTDDGRAEIELADGSVLRLDQGTRIDLRNLADAESRYEKTDLLALEQGSLRIDAADSDSSDKVFQIDTEGGSIYLHSGGTFRIDAEGSAVTVSSLRGVAELAGDGGSVLVRSGERSSVGQGGAPADPRAFNTMRRDDFDRFCEERQTALLRHVEEPLPQGVEESLPREVSPYAGELSVYGDWRSVPEYGWVWRPTYYGGWGPYLYGDWVWSPTGWVWVSNDPWGWAPYHYGRWSFTADLGWFWIPGGVWRGAWVSFAVGPSYLGWCPLDFYNRPVFTDVTLINLTNVNVTRLDVRGWRFLPLSRVGAVRGSRSVVVRPDRLPHGTEVVVTDRLPRFEPRGIAARPDQGTRLVELVRSTRAAPVVATATGSRPVPFRVLEQQHGRVVRGRPPSPALQSPAPRTMPQPAPARPSQGYRPRGERERVAPGAGFGGPPVLRPVPSPRERMQGPAPSAPRVGSPRGRPMRSIPPSEARPQATPAPPAAPPGPVEERDRGRERSLERLFSGVRRDRPAVGAAPPVAPRPTPPPSEPATRPETRPPRRGSPPPQARPRETPRETPENPPKERGRHHRG